MAPSLVILTGASGSGKTTLAGAIQQACPPHCEVLFFDSVGVPSAEAMRAFGDGHQPGGAWQRATTLQWMERIAAKLHAGISVLFEGQMRIAFIHEALALSGIEGAHIILVDCDDATRDARLHIDRNQPELANADMMAWSRYLRDEATQTGCEILDTGLIPLNECQDRIVRLLTDPDEQIR
jgi:energy-coupling factor transporter ATP-binding protein EcfA2